MTSFTDNPSSFNGSSFNFDYSRTIEAAYANEYGGNPMTYTASYNGKLVKYYNN